MSQIKKLDLNPSTHLLNPNFDGYKLCLAEVSKIKKSLSVPPDRVYVREDQYSFLHVQLFGLHNHLIQDPWNKSSAYFIDKDFVVQCVRYNDNKLNINAVFQCTEFRRKMGNYNFTLIFVSEKYCLLSNGAGSLSLLDTNDRYADIKWKCIYSNSNPLDVQTDFFLQDARIEFDGNTHFIHCLLLHIEKNENQNQCEIDWICLKKQLDKTWNIHQLRKYKSKSIPNYCVLETESDTILFCSKHSFTLDQSNDSEKSNDFKDKSDISDKQFTWKQTEEDVLLQFSIAKFAKNEDFNIISHAQRLNIFYKSLTLFDSELYSKIEAGLTTWHLVSDHFELHNIF